MRRDKLQPVLVFGRYCWVRGNGEVWYSTAISINFFFFLPDHSNDILFTLKWNASLSVIDIVDPCICLVCRRWFPTQKDLFTQIVKFKLAFSVHYSNQEFFPLASTLFVATFSPPATLSPSPALETRPTERGTVEMRDKGWSQTGSGEATRRCGFPMLHPRAVGKLTSCHV